MRNVPAGEGLDYNGNTAMTYYSNNLFGVFTAIPAGAPFDFGKMEVGVALNTDDIAWIQTYTQPVWAPEPGALGLFTAFFPFLIRRRKAA